MSRARLQSHVSESLPLAVDALSAMYLGDETQTTVEVYVDSTLLTNWTSSGTTDDLETIDLSGSSGQEITIMGILADSEWLNITEVQICVPISLLEGVSVNLMRIDSGRLKG